MTGVDDAWRHDELGWLPHQMPHQAGVDDEQLAETQYFTPQVVPNASTNALGIDCASYQGQPDWAQVAASGRSFAYLKASQGVNSSYPSLDGQYQGANAAGLKTGLYHFADPSQAPEANADAFSVQVNRLGAIQGHLPPCLDLETGTGDLSGWAQRFVARLRANTGCVRVVVYSNASFFRTSITENWMDANIALWIANFGAPPGQPSYLTPRVAIHQYSSTGQVSGVAGNVDLDWCVWPLSTLIPSETPPATNPPAATTVSVLTPDEQAKLTASYQQFSGSPTVGQWPGWPAWPGGSVGRSYTLVDWVRYIDTQNVALKAELDSLKAQAGITPGAASAVLSDADKTAIASAVVAMLAARLQS